MAGGLNLYGYGAGDPINNSDPFGLCPPAPCGAEMIEVFRRLSTLKRNLVVLPTITITAGPVSAQFGASGTSMTANSDIGFALTIDGTIGKGAGELGTVGVGGVAGMGFVGGGTLNVSENGVEGVTFSIGVGGKLPVGKALELSSKGKELLRAAGRVNVGLGDDTKTPRAPEEDR